MTPQPMIQKKTEHRLYDPVDNDPSKNFDYSEFHKSTMTFMLNNDSLAAVDNTC